MDKICYESESDEMSVDQTSSAQSVDNFKVSNDAAKVEANNPTSVSNLKWFFTDLSWPNKCVVTLQKSDYDWELDLSGDFDAR